LGFTLEGRAGALSGSPGPAARRNDSL